MRRLLITGGAGFLGPSAAAHFGDLGWRVTVLDCLARSGAERNLRWLRDRLGSRLDVVPADVRDGGALREAVPGAGAILHLAGQVAVTTSLTDPRTDFDVNARGTLDLLEAARLGAPEAPFLFASTNKVYGALDGRRAPVAEDQPLDPHTPYACSKAAADQYVRDYARCYGLPTVVLRQSCVYGEHQHGTADQGWVAHFVRSVLARRPLTIHGDGSQVRDLLDARDLVGLYAAAIERIDRCRGEALNVGGGPDNARSLLQVIATVEELTGCCAEYRFAEARPGDQACYVSDLGRVADRLGWRPAVGVEPGLDGLVRWVREAAP